MNHLFSTYHQVLETLDKQSGQLFEEFADDIQCKKGCSGCCVNGFKVRYIEGINLLQGFAQAQPEVAAQIIENLENKNQENKEKTVCPLLINGACSLYNHRPSLCRAFGIIIQMDETLASCDLNFKKPAQGERPLKKLNISPYYDILDELSQSLWEAQPLPTLSIAGEAPRFDIRRLFKAFIRAQSLQAPERENHEEEALNPVYN